MAQQVLVERGQGALRLVAQVPGQPFGQGVERAVGVARLRDAVGVEEQLVPVAEGHHLQAGESSDRARSPSGGAGWSVSTAATSASRISSGERDRS